MSGRQSAASGTTSRQRSAWPPTATPITSPSKSPHIAASWRPARTMQPTQATLTGQRTPPGLTTCGTCWASSQHRGHDRTDTHQHRQDGTKTAPAVLFLCPCRFLTLPPEIAKNDRNAPPRFFGLKGIPRHQPIKRNAASGPAEGKEAGKTTASPYACARVNSGRG